MTPEQERALIAQMQSVLAGASPDAYVWPDDREVYGWRLIRWEADVPLTDDQRHFLLDALAGHMQPAGLAVGHIDEDDTLTILLCLTRFPARAHRDTVLWLCMYGLLETCSVSVEQEGTFLIGEEFASLTRWQEHLSPMMELSEWWNTVSPMAGTVGHRHRAQLQTVIKRRQYTALGGYITRVLRTETEINRVCFAFVPLVIESIWNQHAELGLRRLTEHLRLNEMARRPKEALLNWVASLPEVLRSAPAAGSVAPIERVIASIQADCSLPYSQANLSRSLGLTPAYFCRLFHEKTGQHFSTFLTRTRMDKAQELLSQPGVRPLQEISQACGYPNKSYFCQVFKKYTGLTPGEFEQQCAAHRDTVG